MSFLRFAWKLFVMAGVFGVGYVIGREHSFEEEEQWNRDEKNGGSECKKETEGASEVDFEFEDEDAVSVSLVGSFNDWSKSANPMKKEDGIWKCTLNLLPGKYEYQFVVNDTDWKADPKSDTVKNKYEGVNSVIEIK
jgi:1,4-alpha-glucan branching enzyme